MITLTVVDMGAFSITNKMKRVLVAGATGYLGRYVAKEFKERGYWVRVLVRKKSLKKLEEVGPFLQPSIKEYIDDIFIGEITDIQTLQGLCKDIDIVFSSVGITRQKEKLSFMDVDYHGNKNLLELSLKTNVEKFIFVSAFNVHLFSDLEIAKARERFVEDLKCSGIEYAVIRPTGFFPDATEFLKMALSGRVYLVGKGENKINPIHGADLAKICVDAVENGRQEIPVGGPVVYTYREIAELAFSVIGRKPKITSIPVALLKLIVKAIRPFNRHYYTLAEFFLRAMQNDFVAPKTGTHSLKEYYEEFLQYRNSR